MRTTRRSSPLQVAAVALGLVLMAALLPWTDVQSVSIEDTTKKNDELLVVYDFLPHVVREPHHLDLINVTASLRPRPELLPIDEVHLRGLVHTGSWIFVVDSSSQILVMKRGPQLVTCPNAWSLVGEHTLGREDPQSTVSRGVHEELGPHVLRHARLIMPLTPNPVYYFREYGPRNGDRVDRQVTGLWYIQLDCIGQHTQLKLDNEVAEHRWLSISEMEQWITDSHNAPREGRDGRLCHETIVSLSQLGIARLKEALNYDGSNDGR